MSAALKSIHTYRMDFWLARGSVATIAALQLLIVNNLTVGPQWFAPALELTLLRPLSIAKGCKMIRLSSTTFRVLFWGALAFALFMALNPHPPEVPGAPGDKLQHTLAFGVLTVLAISAYPLTELLRIGERLSFLGAMIEVLQSIPCLHRDCDVLDWAADTVVIVTVLLLIAAIRWRIARQTR